MLRQSVDYKDEEDGYHLIDKIQNRKVNQGETSCNIQVSL